jgi:DNA-binding transcriptional LysR family regulator
VSCLESVALPELPVWIVMHEDLRQTPRIRAVFDHLVEAFGAYCRR